MSEDTYSVLIGSREYKLCALESLFEFSAKATRTRAQRGVSATTEVLMTLQIHLAIWRYTFENWTNTFGNLFSRATTEVLMTLVARIRFKLVPGFYSSTFWLLSPCCWSCLCPDSQRKPMIDYTLFGSCLIFKVIKIVMCLVNTVYTLHIEDKLIFTTHFRKNTHRRPPIYEDKGLISIN